jgi:transcriptional regulator with XRE-family HTH domain
MDEAWKRKFARKIGRRLRAARQLRGLGYEELAARAGIPATKLKRYEAGAERITVRELEQLAAALRLPVTHFLEACTLCGSA